MKEKQRHGCLTAWLVLMIIANAITGLSYVLGGSMIADQLAQMSEVTGQTVDIPGWSFPVLGALAIVNLICALALWGWKKWGFYGFAVTSALAVVVNMIAGLGITSALAGLIGLALLYGVLQIGSENKGWPQLD